MRTRHKKKIEPTLSSTSLSLQQHQHYPSTTSQRSILSSGRMLCTGNLLCVCFGRTYEHMCSHVSPRYQHQAPAPAITIETVPDCKCEKNTISFWRRCNRGPPAARSPAWLWNQNIKTFNTRRETYKQKKNKNRIQLEIEKHIHKHSHTLDLYSKN